MNRRRYSNTSNSVLIALAAIGLSIFAALGAWADSITPAPAGTPAEKPAAAELPVLHLNNGDYATGTLADCDDHSLLRWQCSAATEPFDFLLSSVSGVYFPLPKEPAQAAGDFCVELAGGDLVFGSVANLTNKELVLKSPLLGTLHIDRSKVVRLVRWKGSTALVYSGPHGLSGWEQPLGQSTWREEAGAITTDRPSAAVFGKLDLPAKASLEFDLSWKTKPDFCVTIGAVNSDVKAARPFQLQVLNSHLVARCESDKDADVDLVSDLPPGPSQVHLQVYIDQEQGRMLVFADNGRHWANVLAKGVTVPAKAGIQLVNNLGDVRLERLRVNRWTGSAPRDTSNTAAHLTKPDGSAVAGEVDRFDPASREFVIHGSDGDVHVASDQVESIVLTPPADAPPAAVLRVAMNDSACLSGKLEKVSQHQLRMSCPGIAETVAVPVDRLQSIIMLSHDSFTPQEAGRTGRLELEGVRLKGSLTDSHDSTNGDASCLVWHPQSSQTGSPLRKDVFGRIVYRDPPPAAPKNPQATTLRGQLQGRQAGQVIVQGGGVLMLQGQQIQGPVVLNAVIGAVNNDQPPPAGAITSSAGPALYLRAGDVIPCRVTGITEEGVQFQSPITDAKFVPHSHVKAVELLGNAAARPLDKARRERLLTLPRMQRDNPPTQLVVSTNGDYLRGRLNQMDDKKLTMEVQLDSRELARNRVAKIIWFHPDELDGAKPAADPPPEVAPGLRVQAQRNDGVRLTFAPERMANVALSGTSDVLGPCRVDLMQIDQLLLGSAIEAGAAQTLYGKWKLHHAKEPQFAQDNPQDGGANPNAGTQSPLVGKPAPDFDLKLLGGGKFRLSEHKGHVVVLDFWATWCGPCVNAMPQVDKAVEELKDQQVELVAVNMQEDQKAIKGLLERLDLNPTVALDQDGKTAEKYSVTAIPQTVVIDADGNIARLFVGTSPTFGEQLSASLKDVLEKKSAPGDAAAPADPKK